MTGRSQTRSTSVGLRRRVRLRSFQEKKVTGAVVGRQYCSFYAVCGNESGLTDEQEGVEDEEIAD
jgi:hypothetical protein